MTGAPPPVADNGDLTPEQRRELLARLLAERAKAEETVHPLSHNQRSMWFIQRLGSHITAYNLAVTFRFTSPVDVPALQAAVQTLVDRHGALRTRFVERSGEPFQVVRPDQPVDFEVVDAAGWGERSIKNRLSQEIHTPFDLEDSVMRVRLFQMSESRQVFQIVVHHIVTDGASLWIMLDELRQLYAAKVGGAAVDLPALNHSYTDFVSWQEQLLGSDAGDDMWAYWRDTLQAPDPLNLPTDFQRPAESAFVGDSVRFTIERPLVKQLRAFARDRHTTLFAVLTAGYHTLLHRYSGDEQILTGTPVLGRTKTEFGPIVGDFVNTAVLSNDLGDDPTFEELVDRTRPMVNRSLANQDYPFSLIVEQLAPMRDLSRNPIVQAAINLMQVPTPIKHLMASSEEAGIEADFGGLSVEHLDLSADQQTGQFDLNLEMVDDEDEIHSIFKYRTELFTAETTQQLASHFVHLLEAAMEDPRLAVSTLELVDEPDVRASLATINNTERALPDGGSVLELIAERCRDAPQKTALVFGTTEMSYGELDERSNSFARLLTSHGVGPGDTVGIHTCRSVEMVVAMLAIWKTGGAYLPLDPVFPDDRLRYMVEHSGTRHIVTDSPDSQVITESGAAPIVLTEAWSALDQFDSAGLGSVPERSDLAYVIYTSGSTGTPKGVQVEHENVLNFCVAMGDRPGLAADDRLLAITTISFDISVLELFFPLTVGATVVVADGDSTLDGRKLAGLLDEHRVTVMQGTPSTWSMLIAAGWDRTETLTRALCGGDRLSRDLADQLLASGLELWNLYGPTETTVWSTAAKIEAGSDTISLGTPIANTQVHVLDSAGRPCPCGVRGELYIGGLGVTRGYVELPEETVSRFIPDLIDDQAGPLYRTGDIVRQARDGSLMLLGRSDHQVKVRGYRIELGEIEQTLIGHNALRDAVVVTQGSETDTRLVAFVLPNDAEDAPTRQELIDHLSGTLPPYMVPAAFVDVDEFPQTPNRKIDRLELSRREVVMPVGELDRLESETERLVAEIWKSVLGVDEVGRHQNFFELGGHSLLATQVLSRIEVLTQQQLPLAEFFASPTIAGVSAIVERANRSVIDVPEVEILSRAEPLPLSYAQERIWFLNELAPGNAAYNVVAVYQLDGEVQLNLLEEAVQVLVGRHEALRTLIKSGMDGPVQEILETASIPPTVVDISDLPVEDRDTEIRNLLSVMATEPFDFATDPAWRMLIVRVEPEQHVVITAMHHVIFDQWSSGIFFSELVALYDGLTRGQPAELQPMTAQYADLAVWQRRWFESGALEEATDYWRSQLAGLPTLTFPTDHVRPPLQQYAGSSVRRDIDPELAARIRKKCVEHQVTPFMMLFTTFSLLLEKYSGQQDIPIGVPVANRHRLVVENIIGTFVNSLIMRVDLDEDPSFEELLARVRSTALDAYAHQEVPFERLVSELAGSRDLSRQPLFQVMFNMVNAPFTPGSLDDLAFSARHFQRESSQVDLSMNAIFDEYEVLDSQIDIEYATSLFDPQTIESLLDHYFLLLEQAIDNDQARISEFSIVSDDERERLEGAWNETLAEFPDNSVHSLFSEQATADPSRTAVTCGEESLTYGELDERSNRLANHLVSSGVGPGTIVGLYVDRSVEMVVGLLGIMKSGAGYLPLDPSFPRERLEYMMSDSAAPMLLTQQALPSLDPGDDVTVIMLDNDWPDVAKASAEPVTSSGSPSDVMYLIYTSGSTGRPKAVVIEHHSVVNFLTSMRAAPGLSRDDVLLSVTTLSFDISVLEIFLPLTTGSHLVIATRDIAADGVQLSEALASSGCTVMQATPATWSMLIEAGWDGTSSLERALCGGEALSRKLADQLLDRAPELWNMYGPTETTIWSAVEKIEPGDGPITIGAPIANTTFSIVDSQTRTVPVGVPGELLIGGVGLAREYLNRPDLTAERFIDDPFNPTPGSRLYRTGDLARFRSDGTVEFMGRIDSQVKIRGFRIELGEIEHLLGTHPGVQTAVAVAKRSAAGDAQLVAYYIPSGDGPEPELSEWRDFLRSSLPNYMIPSAFAPIGEFPMTPNRKVDRNALPEVSLDQRRASVHVAPSGHVQETLASIWQDVLGVENLGADDDFFAIGGDSLRAVRIFARIRRELEVDLHLSVLFEHSTVAGLADHIERTNDGLSAAGRSAYRFLVDVATGDSGVNPLFCVHGAGGHILFMEKWRQHMGPFPLVGIQAIGADGQDYAPDSIEEMAGAYVAEIQRYQPEGPICLAGYSIGGTVAYEMAQQLEAAGREVALLVFVDTFHPNVIPEQQTFAERCVDWVKKPAMNLRKLYRTRIQWPIIVLSHRFGIGNDRFAIDDTAREVFMVQRFDVMRMKYTPKVYDGPVLLLRSAETWPIYSHVDRLRGWTGLATNLVVRDVPGDHRTTVEEPHAAITVATMIEGLADVDGSRSDPLL